MAGFIESTKEASKGGFKAIKKVRGLLAKIDLVDPPETWDSEDKQIKVDLEDVTILEMFDNEEPVELKDGKYSFYIKYAAEGKKPSANSIYVRCWLTSAEKLGKKPTELLGQYVTLDKVPTVGFKKAIIDEETKKPKIDPETGKKLTEDVIYTTGFCFVADEGGDTTTVKDYITNLVLGLNTKAALRKLLVDTRAKQFPEYKDKLKNGTLAAELGLKIDEKDIFVKAS